MHIFDTRRNTFTVTHKWAFEEARALRRERTIRVINQIALKYEYPNSLSATKWSEIQYLFDKSTCLIDYEWISRQDKIFEQAALNSDQRQFFSPFSCQPYLLSKILDIDFVVRRNNIVFLSAFDLYSTFLDSSTRTYWAPNQVFDRLFLSVRKPWTLLLGCDFSEILEELVPRNRSSLKHLRSLLTPDDILISPSVAQE